MNIRTPKTRTTLIGLALYLACTASLFFIPDENLRVVRATLTGLTFLVILLFIISYHVMTRGHWRDSVHGVHIMAFSVAMDLIMLFLVLALFSLIPMWLLPIIGAWIYLTVLFLFLWRWVILRAGQRVPKDEK